ncbi:hypothetical protein BY458DRAFT_418311, partial [Sporodiniella umbellata]
VFELGQRRIGFSTRYLKVKSERCRDGIFKTLENLVQSISFWKDILVNKNFKPTLIVQDVDK